MDAVSQLLVKLFGDYDCCFVNTSERCMRVVNITVKVKIMSVIFAFGSLECKRIENSYFNRKLQ